MGPAPPVRNDGLLATPGRPDPVPPPPPAPPFVAIAVGKTKDGESLPAKPNHEEAKSAQSRVMDGRGERPEELYLAWRSPCRWRRRRQQCVDYTARNVKALNSFKSSSHTASLKGSGVEQLQLFITAMPRERGP